jgi:hypothetical protein
MVMNATQGLPVIFRWVMIRLMLLSLFPRHRFKEIIPTFSPRLEDSQGRPIALFVCSALHIVPLDVS